MEPVLIRSVSFDAGGSVVIEYLLPSSIRENGISMHTALVIPAEYEEIDELLQAARAALAKGLEEFSRSPASDVMFGETDEPSPYDNPEER